MEQAHERTTKSKIIFPSDSPQGTVDQCDTLPRLRSKAMYSDNASFETKRRVGRAVTANGLEDAGNMWNSSDKPNPPSPQQAPFV